MKVFSGFVGAVILLVCFSSCQKEIDWELNNRTQADSIYIQKIISLDTTLPSGLDTGFITLYNYDSRKRVLKKTETEYDLGVQYTNYYFYSYLGNDTLPYKYVNTSNYAPDSLITFLSYNNGFIVKDSTVYYLSGVLDDVLVQTFTSLGSGNFLFRSQFENPVLSGSFQTYDSIRYIRDFLNSNLISGVDSTWRSGVWYNKTSFQNIFDTQKNPFLKFSTWYLGYKSELFTESNSEGKNNVTALSTISVPGGTENISISYSYNTNGYPIIGRMSGIVDFNKAVFIYTVL